MQEHKRKLIKQAQRGKIAQAYAYQAADHDESTQ